jgi:hypothetical protein
MGPERLAEVARPATDIQDGLPCEPHVLTHLAGGVRRQQTVEPVRIALLHAKGEEERRRSADAPRGRQVGPDPAAAAHRDRVGRSATDRAPFT